VLTLASGCLTGRSLQRRYVYAVFAADNLDIFYWNVSLVYSVMTVDCTNSTISTIAQRRVIIELSKENGGDRQSADLVCMRS
jgi:hypothetical protein